MTPEAHPLSGCTAPRVKITNYLLNQAHRVGGAKARFFLGLGFSPTEWQQLAAALTEHPNLNPLAATIPVAYGVKYLVRCSLKTPDGRNPCIVTVWMKDSDAPPRLVTAYPT